MIGDNIKAKTYFYDSLRNFFQGTLEVAFGSLALLIAIRFFHASGFAKTVLVSANWIGGLFAPWVIYYAARINRRATLLAALCFGIISLCFFSSAMVSHLWIYILCYLIASLFFRIETPLTVAIYSQNYPTNERAGRFSLGLILSSLMAIIFSYVSGRLLDWQLSSYRLLLLAIAIGALLSAYCFLRIPSRPVESQPTEKIWHYFHYLKSDGLFGKMTLNFFLVGLAYQMLIPIKIEYLIDSNGGISRNNFSIMLLCSLVPSLVRVLSTRFLAVFFDRHRFLTTRLWINALTMIAIILFFNSRNFGVLFLASIFFGLSMAGSFLMHTLWLSRVAPPEKISIYMSIYTFTTSVRSVIAPILGYSLMAIGSPRMTGNLGFIIVLLSTYGFWRLRNLPRPSEDQLI